MQQTLDTTIFHYSNIRIVTTYQNNPLCYHSCRIILYIQKNEPLDQTFQCKKKLQLQYFFLCQKSLRMFQSRGLQPFRIYKFLKFHGRFIIQLISVGQKCLHTQVSRPGVVAVNKMNMPSFRKCEQPDTLKHAPCVLNCLTYILHLFSRFLGQMFVHAMAAAQQLLGHYVTEQTVNMKLCSNTSWCVFVVYGCNSLLRDHARGTF